MLIFIVFDFFKGKDKLIVGCVCKLMLEVGDMFFFIVCKIIVLFLELGLGILLISFLVIVVIWILVILFLFFFFVIVLVIIFFFECKRCMGIFVECLVILFFMLDVYIGGGVFCVILFGFDFLFDVFCFVNMVDCWICLVFKIVELEDVLFFEFWKFDLEFFFEIWLFCLFGVISDVFIVFLDFVEIVLIFSVFLMFDVGCGIDDRFFLGFIEFFSVEIECVLFDDFIV